MLGAAVLAVADGKTYGLALLGGSYSSGRSLPDDLLAMSLSRGLERQLCGNMRRFMLSRHFNGVVLPLALIDFEDFHLPH